MSMPSKSSKPTPKWLRNLGTLTGVVTVTPPVLLSLLMVVVVLFPVLLFALPVVLVRGLEHPVRRRRRAPRVRELEFAR